MSYNFFYFGILPVVAFILIDAFSKNIRVAIAAAAVCSIAEFCFILIFANSIDPISLIATILFLLLGILSVHYNNKTYFKLQPAILSVICAFYIAALQLSSTTVIVRYFDILKKASPPSMSYLLDKPKVIDFIDTSINWFVIVILIEAAWLAYTALRKSELMWLLVNAIGIWILGFVMLVIQIFYYYLTNQNPLL